MTVQGEAMSTPETVGLSSARLQYIDKFLKTKYLDTRRLPCVLTLIERRGQIAHCSALGQMDIERQRPITTDTVFRIYSMTKPLTSIAFMMLVEEGLIALDDPVHRYIPEWRDLPVYQAGQAGAFRTRRTLRPMLVVDLLRHTSGLTYDFQQRTNVDAAYRQQRLGVMGGAVPLAAMIEALGKLPLEFSPGESWNYSVSTDVLGFLIVKISGEPFDEFLRKRLLRPLGMNDTDFFVSEANRLRFAACYAATPDGGMRLQDDPTASSYLRPPAYVSGGGGLVSTAADYLRFCRMLRNGGSLDGMRFVSPKTLALMTVNHLPGNKDLTEMSVSLFSEASYTGVGFGLGFAVTMDLARTLVPGTAGDFAWGGMASTYFWIDPREELITIFMTQLIPSATWPIRRELRTLVYSAFQ